MATYAFGDLQGCADELQAALDLINFNPTQDRLWFTGDLINRGPKSLDTLRLVKALGSAAVTVLGNHDLHLLAAAANGSRIAKSDTFTDILDATDRDELLDWLRHQRLAYHEQIGDEDFLMVHAGVLPAWTLADATRLAHEVEAEFQSSRWQTLAANMYGNGQNLFDETLLGLDRLRAIINVLTRLRFCSAAGVLDLKSKEGAGQAQPGFMPWFEVPQRATSDITIVNGHWSTLGLRIAAHHLALDTGCVWGGTLTAIRLEDRQVFSVPCKTHLMPGSSR